MRARYILPFLTAMAAAAAGLQAHAATATPATPPSQAEQILPDTAVPPAAPAPRVNGTSEQIIPGDKYSQQVERIQIQDPGAKIDELRVGGQTKDITVKPNAPVPSYNVQPANDSVSSDFQDRSRGPGSTGPRTWKILGF